MVMLSRKYLRDLGEACEVAQKKGKYGEFVTDLREQFRTGDRRISEFSLKTLFEEVVPDGHAIMRDLFDPSVESNGQISRLLEADVVKTSTFSNITGQIFYSAVLEQYNLAANVFTPMIPTIPTQLDGEKIAGIGGIGDLASVVAEAEAYPNVGVNEDWIRTPSLRKRGMIIEITREALFFDRTNQLLQQANQIGTWLGINTEKRAIDCIIDENTTAHRYNRKDRGAVATYGDNSGNHDWDNLQASNALVDWTDIDGAAQLLYAITDPNTGEPINLGVTRPMLICARELEMTAKRIVNSTQVEHASPGYATSGNPVVMYSPNPVSNTFDVMTSPLVASRLGTDTSWFYGDPSKAFRRMENFPLAVIDAPANSEAEFQRDVVIRKRVSQRDAFVTFDPRYMVKCTA